MRDWDRSLKYEDKANVPRLAGTLRSLVWGEGKPTTTRWKEEDSKIFPQKGSDKVKLIWNRAAARAPNQEITSQKKTKDRKTSITVEKRVCQRTIGNVRTAIFQDKGTPIGVTQ